MFRWVHGYCHDVRCGTLVVSVFRNATAAQRESFWAGYPADVLADIWADVLGQKLSPNHSERRNIHCFCADILDPKVQTIHDAKRSQKNLMQENFELTFRSLSLSLLTWGPKGPQETLKRNPQPNSWKHMIRCVLQIFS